MDTGISPVSILKTVNGRTKNYLWDGGKLLSQTFTNDTQVFLYHGDSRVALEFMGQLYYYVYNLQGDVVGLVDKTGTTMVTYKYDVWGKPESTTGPMATTLGSRQPVPLPWILLRYRIRVLLSPEPVL